ncbi:protein spt2-like isoform X2 [Salvia hispanica]|uniref:protein spt2-like isoform X2 n=1 Tax=Salvia hispanica TaxID=49212 RepID=UPI002008F026|nr:protein spt2-like isoform X2 [Salvia hispanica]
MRGYEKDEYENWDEYEEDGEEQEEEEGGDDDYEEVHQPTQEELDYLAIRQKLKESIRKKMKKDAGTANSASRNKVNASRKDNYGSFFGPSQPIIAQRVIQESKSLLENPDLAARMCKSSQKEKKTYVSAPVSSKSQAPPYVKNGLKKKVEILKNTRDYSFLLLDDAEVPASSKGLSPRNVSAPKSDARSAEFMHRSSRLVVNGRVREVSNGRDGRKPMLPCSQSKAKVGMDNVAHTNKSSAESRKQFGNNSGSGPGRPLGHKVVPSKSSVPATAKSAQPVAKNINSGVRKPTSSSLQPVARRPISSNLKSGNNRPTSSHGQPSTLRRPVQKDYHGTTKPKVVSKQLLPSSKVQTKISPQRHPARVPSRDERPKAKPKRQLHDEDSEGADAINLIRQMFGYNPNRFRDDDDTDDMEANFDDIIREEKRSSRIAKQEDEEQRILIEEEERRERMRQAKKRKMSR